MKRDVTPLMLALIVALALVAGCAPKGAVDVTPTAEASPTAATGRATPTLEEAPEGAPEPTPANGARPAVPADAEAALAWAKADLAGRLGVADDAITVAAIEAVEWSDSSIGCPQEGYMYLQVITPGYRILLRAGDATYEYHSARGADEAVYCEPD